MPILAEVDTEITLSVATVIGWALGVIGALALAVVYKEKQVSRALSVADRATRIAERLQRDEGDDGDDGDL